MVRRNGGCIQAVMRHAVERRRGVGRCCTDIAQRVKAREGAIVRGRRVVYGGLSAGFRQRVVRGAGMAGREGAMDLQ